MVTASSAENFQSHHRPPDQSFSDLLRSVSRDSFPHASISTATDTSLSKSGFSKENSGSIPDEERVNQHGFTEVKSRRWKRVQNQEVIDAFRKYGYQKSTKIPQSSKFDIGNSEQFPDLSIFSKISGDRLNQKVNSNSNFEKFGDPLNAARFDLYNLNQFPNLNNSSDSSSVRRETFNAYVKPATWSSIVAEESKSTYIPIPFFPPVMFKDLRCAKMPAKVALDAKEKWKYAIVLYAMGPKPYYHYFQAYINRVWKPSGDFQIYSRENGFYIVNFNKQEDCDNVLANGPYFYDKRLLMIKKWVPGMKMTKDFLKSIPVWVRFPNLDLDFWTEEGIGRIASLIGTPIKLDEVTSGMKRLSFARVLIEVDSNFNFPSLVPVLDDQNNLYWQEVKYEWKPYICSRCRCFGHLDRACKFTTLWIPKQTSQAHENSNDMDMDPLTQVNIKSDFNFQHSTHKKQEDNLIEMHDTSGAQPDIIQSGIMPLPVEIQENQNILQPVTQNNDNDSNMEEDVNKSSEHSLTNGNNEVSSPQSISKIDGSGDMIDDPSPVEDTAIQNSCKLTSHSNSSLRQTRRSRVGESSPFEFKASVSSDVVDNPAWANLVSQFKSKGRRSKKSKMSATSSVLDCREH